MSYCSRRAQRLVIGLRESLAGLFHVPRGAVERTERETHVVGVDRFGITLREFAQGPFGIGAAQLHGAGGQVKIRLLGQQTVRRRQRRPDAQEFLPGVAPAAVIEQVAGAPREGLYFRPGSLRAEGARARVSNEIRNFRICIVSLNTGKYTNFCPSAHYQRNGICPRVIVEHKNRNP